LQQEEGGTGWSWQRRAYRQDARGSEATPGQCGWKPGKLANLRRMIDAFRTIPPQGKELLRAEIESLRDILGESELDLKRQELESLQESLHEFFSWLLEEELDNYKENEVLKEELRRTLEAAAEASSRLLRPSGA
jgi:hypothetical protein